MSHCIKENRASRHNANTEAAVDKIENPVLSLTAQRHLKIKPACLGEVQKMIPEFAVQTIKVGFF